MSLSFVRCVSRIFVSVDLNISVSEVFQFINRGLAVPCFTASLVRSIGFTVGVQAEVPAHPTLIGMMSYPSS